MSPDSGKSAITTARRVFEAAIGEQGLEREVTLTRECKGDAALRALVEQLIAADQQVQPILDQALGQAFGLAASPVADGSGEPALKPGDVVGSYRIVREIGVGGMGSVYQAEQVPDGGFVAIKVVRWSSQEISRRFQQEQAILSRLRHPNVARLLDSGTTGAQSPYFVMEYVEGVPIHSYCERKSISIDERVRLFRQVCAAVVYLHQHLVVHRDLKPGNVLVTTDGIVKLVDFGIAKLLQAPDGLLTPVKTIAGLMTPDYASPEQIRGGVTSTVTDVYSLGVMLYELLAGERPFTAPSDHVHETLRRICEEEPQKPSAAAAKHVGRQSRKLRGELDNIILKAIQKEPWRRYASAEQLDEDMRRYLDHQPVMAQGDSPAYRVRKFVVRYKGAVAAATAMILLLSGGVIATSIEARIALQERTRAEGQAREADRQRANAERRLEELQKLAGGLVQSYRRKAATQAPSQGMAQNVHDSLMLLGKEQELEPGLAEVLDRTAATVQSYELANDPAWHVPAGWTARETVAHEYRVGVDHQIVRKGRSSLFLRSLVAHPAGSVSVFQRFDAERYRGKRVRLAAYLRSESVSPQAVLTLNASGATARAEVSGTTSWKKYELVSDVPESGDWIELRVKLEGSGTVWADNFAFAEVSAAVPLTLRQPRNLSFTEPKE